MRPFKRTFTTIKQASTLAPARPAYAAGLRAAVATVAPLAVAHFLDLASGATWMSLAGFNVALADRGGPYRTRAITMSFLTIACAASVSIGTLGSAHRWTAVLFTFVVALACGLGRVWGVAGASVGGAVLNSFVIALAFPPSTFSQAIARAGFVAIGGAWAMLIALVLWPLKPFRPVRVAVAASYRALAAYVDEIATLVREPSSDVIAASPTTVAALRTSLETARAALATMRRGRGESGRVERLIVLRENADQMFGHIIALRDTVDLIPREERDSAVQEAIADVLGEIAATAHRIADDIEEEETAAAIPVTWNGDRVGAAIGAASEAEEISSDVDSVRAHYLQTVTLLDRLAQFAAVGAATAETLNLGGPIPALDGILEVQEPDAPPPLLAPLRAIISGDSLVLRYALRVAIVTTIAVWLTAALGLKRGYWVTITIVIILQPYTAATSQKALQRVAGTVLGGILTAALGALFHGSGAILILAFVFTTLCVALLPLNYAIFSIFLTPTFVLLAEASAGDWNLAGTRILNTLLGGALALLGARLLWPSPERSRLPLYMADALRANRQYLARTISLFADRSEHAGAMLRDARRQSGLAAINAEESFDRFLAEHRGPAEDLAPIMTFLTYTRRLMASIAALSVLRHSLALENPEALGEFGRIAARVLEDLEDAAANARRPAALLVLPAPPADPLLRARIDRLARQLKTLHDTIERGGSSGPLLAADVPT